MAYNGQVRFKTGLLVGLAVGYYYGAKAGRQRYQQIDHYLAQVRDSDAYRELRDQVMTLVGRTVALRLQRRPDPQLRPRTTGHE
jgi:hypothetical protein